MEAIMFTNTSVDEIGIDNSSRYPLDEFIHKDDPSRQYQGNFNISYYVIPHGRSIIKLIKEKHILEVIALNEHGLPHTKDTKGPSDLINTKRVNEQNVQNEQIITQPTKGASGNNTEVLVSISESLVPDVSQSHILNQASISSYHAHQDRWSQNQHIEIVNIIGDPGEDMLTRNMVAKLIVASASECLFVEFLSEIEPKKHECFGSSLTIPSNSKFSKDPSKVTPIKLTSFMVAVNNNEKSVNVLLFTVKKKKGKSQTEAMNSLDKNSIARRDILNALNGVNAILKAIQDAVKEDLALNKKLVKASSIVLLGLDALVLFPYKINGKLVYLTEEQFQAHVDKNDQIKNVEEEAKNLAMTKIEAKDAKMQVHKRNHTKKVKRLTELNKKRDEQYM
nr:hypothetical protein [Tanacetum cinerariifolium]